MYGKTLPCSRPIGTFATNCSLTKNKSLVHVNTTEEDKSRVNHNQFKIISHHEETTEVDGHNNY